MISIIKRRHAKKKLGRQNFWNDFLNHPQHDWIVEDGVLLRLFKVLFDSVPKEAILRFQEVGIQPIFSLCSGRWAAAIQPTKNVRHLIVVFPDLIKILYSAAPTHGIAVLAHELGHLYHQHAIKKISMLEAQIEADAFAADCGFAEELQDFLMQYDQSVETKVRISKLTLEYFTSGR